MPGSTPPHPDAARLIATGGLVAMALLLAAASGLALLDMVATALT